MYNLDENLQGDVTPSLESLVSTPKNIAAEEVGFKALNVE